MKRLMAEYKQLTLNPPEGIIAGPVNEENFFEWEALITGKKIRKKKVKEKKKIRKDKERRRTKRTGRKMEKMKRRKKKSW